MVTLQLLDYSSRLIGDPPDHLAAVSIEPPFEPATSGTDPVEVEALAVEVREMGRTLDEAIAEAKQQDAELREVEMRMADLETALDEARDRQLVAYELLEMADIAVANRLDGPKFVEATSRFAEGGGELAGATRSVVGRVKRLLAEGSNVGAVEIAAALRVEAKRLLDPRKATRRQRP
jgi:hypothetical protein